jgi:hypothetical protein
MHETHEMGRKKITSILLIVVAAMVSSCAPNQRIVESNGQLTNAETQRAAATPVRSSLDKDIESMRTADFIFIYLIKRKDGGPLDAEDRQFASAVIPGEMNRRTIADDGKAILIGSNFRMPEESQRLIVERFTFEDLSREVPSTNSNADVNANR